MRVETSKVDQKALTSKKILSNVLRYIAVSEAHSIYFIHVVGWQNIRPPLLIAGR